MLLADTISSTHSTCRVGFILRITRPSSTENCRSLNSSTASGQMPSSRLIFLVMWLMSTLRALARRSGETPRSTARRIMKCSWIVDRRLMRLL